MGGLAHEHDFDFQNCIWLNAAHQGPLPRVAVEAAGFRAHQKAAPWRISDDEFTSVPQRLREVIGALIDVAPSDIILGNSASYGLDLLARGLDWKSGDEVLYVEGEFPASIFPWYAATRHGVRMRSFRAAEGNLPSPDELRAQFLPQTRVFVCSWVNSFTGHTLDVARSARACRDAGVIFVLNASQGVGARGICVRDVPVDVITCCGYKWLLGPYATGFCWINPHLRQRLSPPHAYWLPNVWGYPEGMRSYSLRPDIGARAFDVFAPANFLTFAPWTAAIEYIQKIGVQRIEEHNAELVRAFLIALDQTHIELLSPEAGARQSAIVVLRNRGGAHSADELEGALSKVGIYTATRNGLLRLSPHLYNSPHDMQRGAAILNSLCL